MEENEKVRHVVNKKREVMVEWGAVKQQTTAYTKITLKYHLQKKTIIIIIIINNIIINTILFGARCSYLKGRLAVNAFLLSNNYNKKKM